MAERKVILAPIPAIHLESALTILALSGWCRAAERYASTARFRPAEERSRRRRESDCVTQAFV